ncbi:MAG TPA: leucine-rich repeat-containing protein kinase family protein [Methylotenera sp.]|nr:leucine-rich repeat-containing protein kinase family protein [Methylotenera sp.]HPH05065.1 leucine-rich repeat-containing protein kinase family protein [Methylotenera sp.]HPN02131.1 leucine-rich repeat-containing protein kinase family protein [Methylotenera sp.]
MCQNATHTLEKLRAGQLAGITRLDLSCDLTSFPPEIYTLADSLEILNLSNNALTDLPADLTKLTKLKVLFCSDNQFEHVPEVLGQCENLTMVGFKANKIKALSAKSLPKNLQWLILTDNQLAQLPAQIEQCKHLQKLMLAGNQLSDLPAELANCTQLELLRISANHLTGLPNWLFTMPKLAWLAFAGNPFCHQIETERANFSEAHTINWQDLHIQQPLGQGASGVIYRANLTQERSEKAVAVKLFKGAVTSDGLPINEMAACLHAGSHTHLSQIIGVIANHPNGTQGLVMSLIDASFSVLAAPPSLSSCTRDVYKNNQQFSITTVRAIALGIARAMQHLHKKNISHGDLYAHNILYNQAGKCLLSDFGAASFLPNNASALDLQRLEVRAFACLLEELLAYCEASNNVEIKALTKLQQACGQNEVQKRPLFDEIVQTLEAI